MNQVDTSRFQLYHIHMKEFRLGTIVFLTLLAIPITLQMSQHHLNPTKTQAEAQTLAAVITPTSACKTGVNTFSVETSCPEGYRYAKYTCYDESAGTLGSSSSCKPSSAWIEFARSACNGRSSCGPSITPTMTVCKRGLNSYTFENDCTVPGYTARGHRTMSYSCYDGTKGTFSMRVCQTTDSLVKSATQICQTYDSSCSSATPTPQRGTPTPILWVTKGAGFESF